MITAIVVGTILVVLVVAVLTWLIIGSKRIIRTGQKVMRVFKTSHKITAKLESAQGKFRFSWFRKHNTITATLVILAMGTLLIFGALGLSTLDFSWLDSSDSSSHYDTSPNHFIPIVPNISYPVSTPYHVPQFPNLSNIQPIPYQTIDWGSEFSSIEELFPDYFGTDEPDYYDTCPECYGATAICNDGWISYSQNHRGTCSHHGGVQTWLR